MHRIWYGWVQLFLYFILIAPSHAAIYGFDQRRDVFQLPRNEKKLSESIALAFGANFLTPLDNTHLQHEEFQDRIYGDQELMCKSEKFWRQPSFGHCTAFLVHERVLLTAGHCLLAKGIAVNSRHPYCDGFAFWLNYALSERTDSELGARIPRENVLRCSRVIYAQNDNETNPERDPVDFALLELSQPVTHGKPLAIAPENSVSVNDLVFTMGHPHGLPLKHSGTARVLDADYLTSFSVNLDTLGGNSGGPVFNTDNQVVGLLIAGHQFDTYKTQNGCDRINTCRADGSGCKQDSQLFTSNLVLKNSVWLPHLREYLRTTDQ